MSTQHKKIVGSLLGGLLLVLFFYIADFSWDQVFGQIRQHGLSVFAWSIGATVILYYLTARKWQALLVGMEQQWSALSVWALYQYIAVGYIVAFVVPQAISDLGCRGGLLAKNSEVPLPAATYSVLVDQFTSVLISFSFAIPATLLCLGLLSWSGALVGGVVAAVFLVVMIGLYPLAFFHMCAWGYKKMVQMLGTIPLLRNFSQGLTLFDQHTFPLKRRAALRFIILGLLRHCWNSCRLFLIAAGLGLNISFGQIFFCASILLLLGLIAHIPGQLGLGELGWFGALKLLGVADQDIVTFVVAMRIFSNLSIVLVSSVSWLMLSRAGLEGLREAP